MPGNNKYNTKKQAEELLKRLQTADQGLPNTIVLDRDRKFLLEI